MWIHLPKSSLFSLGLECSTEPSESQFLRLSQSAMLSTKYSQPRYWRRAWKIKSWMRHLSGLSLEPSTADRGAKLWILSLLPLPASPTASPEKSRGTTIAEVGETAADLSPTPSELFQSVAPPWSSLRTSQLGFEGAGFYNSETNYRDWVTRSKTRSSSLRATLARVTSERGSSSSATWPTIRASEFCGRGFAKRTPGTGGKGIGGEKNLADDVQLWQTPAADSFRCRGGDRKDEMGLDQEARTWASPTASPNANRTTQRAPSHHAGTHGEVLAGQVADWPTPGANDYKGSAKEGQRRGQLAEAVEQRYSHPVRVQSISGQELSPTSRVLRRRLNPAFVCWLMGWPWWWTNPAPISFAAEEMALWRSRLRWRLRCCLEALGEK